MDGREARKEGRNEREEEEINDRIQRKGGRHGREIMNDRNEGGN